MGGVAVLVDEVRPDADLLRPSPHLSQPQMADLMVSFGRFQPPFAKPPFDVSCLKLLFKEIDLAAEGLALLVHGSLAVDLGHKTPVVDGELVELAAKGGVGGSAPTEGGNEPCG